jgi:hypothetical protein
MPPSGKERFLRWADNRGGVVLRLAVALMFAFAGGASAAGRLPTSEQELVSAVRTAIAERDMSRFEELINWEGASEIKRRIVGFEVRRGFGRPIRSISLEPFPENGLRDMEARGMLKANMPVSHQLRVIYDEPPMEGYGTPPTSVFLIGREGDGFRIALVVRAEKDND